MPRIMPTTDWLLLIAFIIVAAVINGVQGGAMVTGTVFCDQCKDGQVSLFDYPLEGAKVAMACPGSDGRMQMVGEETTNMFGDYIMRFDGTPDLGSCYAQVLAGELGSSGCMASAGPARSLKLMLNMFSMEMYSVDPLLSQPARPMSFCQGSPSPALPPPVAPVPPIKSPPSPAVRLPPMPPVPFFEASACPYQYWMMPEFKCYWKVINPDMKVALIFGPLAEKKYGTDLTLWAGLLGRGDPYRTLLREGITALLNSYNSLLFPYNALSVVEHMNMALTGSTQNVLFTALRFKRANSGSDKVSCKFKACK